MSRIAPDGGYPVRMYENPEVFPGGDDDPVPWDDAPSRPRGRPKTSNICGLCGHPYAENRLRKPLPEMGLEHRRVCALCKSRWLRKKKETIHG